MSAAAWSYRDPPAADRPRNVEDERKVADNARRAVEVWRTWKPLEGSPGERYFRQDRKLLSDVMLYPDSGDGWPETVGWAYDV
jgi:hypothetical protein